MTQNSQISIKQRFSEEPFLGLALSLGVLTTFIALVLYGYLGTFSRYGSDDYCLSAFFLQDHLFNAFIQRYFIASSRYTNILFIGLVDKLFGWYNVAILPALMLALFVLGLYLVLKEVSDMLELRWSRWLILFISLLLVYFSIAQAPDLYETLYWRAGMTSHFAPLVFIPFFGTFLLRQIRKAREYSPSLWIQAASFLIPLVIGGLSEPPTALMITVLGLAIVAAWWWGDVRYRRSILLILFWALLGALTSLIVMAIAPANSIRMQTPPPPLPELISRIIYYPIYFIVDTLRTLPTPTLVSLAVPAVLFYVKYTQPSQPLSKEARKRLIILMLLVFVLAYLFIAATFAPSAYGQSYPAARARFAGRVLMTSALVMEGALLGTLVAQIRTQSFQSSYVRGFAILAVMLLALYPLRTAWRTLGEVPVYQQRAAAWDLRESEIRRLEAEGVQDLIVPFLSKERSQDLGDQTDFRLNRCAAALYGVKSIVAVPVK
ncbi:MAG: DUF6056 family protein [Anaerolineales bacterium]